MRRITIRKKRLQRRTYRQRGGYNTADLKNAIKEDNLTQVETILKDPSVNPQEVLSDVIKAINVLYSRLYLEMPATAPIDHDKLYKEVTESNIYKILTLLLADARIDLSKMVDLIVKHLSGMPHFVFKLLLSVPGIDPTMNKNALFFAAVEDGDHRLVHVLLEDSRIDPSARDNKALFMAENFGYLQIFKDLLADPRMNPGTRENSLIIQASKDANFDEKDFTEFLLPLLDHPKVDPSVLDNIVLWNIVKSYEKERESAKAYNPVFLKLLEDSRVIEEPNQIATEVTEILEHSITYNNTELISSLVAKPFIVKILENSDILDEYCNDAYSEEITRIFQSVLPENFCTTREEDESEDSEEEKEEVPDVELEEVIIKYDNQQARNLIELEDKPLLTLMCDRNHLIVQSGSAFFLSYIDQIKKELNTKTRYECKGQLEGAPYVKDVRTENPYYLLTGEAGSFLIPMNQMMAAIKKYTAIQLVASDTTLPFVASRAVVQRDPGLSMNGAPVNIVSADHCQAGTDKKVYNIRGIVFT